MQRVNASFASCVVGAQHAEGERGEELNAVGAKRTALLTARGQGFVMYKQREL